MAAKKKAAVKKAAARKNTGRSSPTRPQSNRKSGIDPELLIAVVTPDDIVGIDTNLRATFTARGIILSTWGMTDLMPTELCEMVFALWRKHLTENPADSFGRTLEMLEKDIASLRRGD